MSNMSYCMFENTFGDLKDCVVAMEEACTMDELDLSAYERKAMDRMKDLCERFLSQYEHLVASEEEKV